MVTREAVLDVLQTIDDPEMPINIVDLGIVESVRVEADAAGGETRVAIEILPTFVGCPALPVIEEEVRKRVGELSGVGRVEVQFRFDPPWSVDRISQAGRERLRRFGLTVPTSGKLAIASETPEPRCPICGSAAVILENQFGPTRCRMIYYCEACKNPFEHLKRLEIPVLRS
jgi:ring-1,2-phenylacetyl-CoA epoxidase subunit PaaD